jgi:hypothetical protein
MQVQYITDNKGKKKSVVVPFKDWENIQKEMSRHRAMLGIKSAVQEVRQIKDGKKRSPSMDKLLDEL